MEKVNAHVYGPVLSRRLGVSLGVDLVPYKTCTYDCIYCQLGRTTRFTRERADYVPVKDVLEEIKRRLRVIPKPDYITLAGSGEPTLHTRISDIILGIRSLTATPIAIMTNGSLLQNRKVRLDCSLADVVLPNLDAGDESTFNRVNRPHPGISFQSMVDGLEEFRRDFEGQIWLEVMLLYGITDNDAAVRRIARCAGEIYPDRVHLNTAVRPTAEESACAVSLSTLRRLADFFEPKAQVAYYPLTGPGRQELPDDIMSETVLRRPCTLEEIASLMNATSVEVSKITEKMVREGRLRIVRHGGEIFYTAEPEKSQDCVGEGIVNVTGK